MSATQFQNRALAAVATFLIGRQIPFTYGSAGLLEYRGNTVACASPFVGQVYVLLENGVCPTFNDIDSLIHFITQNLINDEG